MGLLNTFTLPAPAKINLFLGITGRRPDGYHNLQTLFQLLDLSDTLTFRLNSESSDISVVCPSLDISQEENIAYKAACLIQLQSKSKLGVQLHIEKTIPDGGGLGGGSSNAATTLLGLNKLWRCGLTKPELMEMGRSLGADVPVFIAGETAWGEGIGELISPVALPSQRYIIVNPGCHVSTKKIFSHPELTRDSSNRTIARFLEQGPPYADGTNDCESVVCSLFPEVFEALGWLSQWGAAKMTGTGSCIFLATPTQEISQEILSQVRPEWQAFETTGTNESVLVNVLSRLD